MELDISKPKKLFFSIEIANAHINSLKGKFILYLDNSLNFGISANVENGKLVVRIPPLKKFGLFKEGKKYKAELWVIAGRDYYSIPWSEEVIIKNSKDFKVDASIKKISEENEPYILVTKPIVIKE